MPRIPTVSILSSLLAAALASASDFPLEDYVPADYHQHYLSVIPDLNWNVYSSTDDYPVEWRERTFDSYTTRLRLNQGSEKFAQEAAWKVSNGLSLDMSGQGNDNGTRRPLGLPWIESYHTDQDQGSVRYDAFSRISGNRYLFGAWFIAPSSELDLTHIPLSGGKDKGWTLGTTRGLGDSTQFRLTRGESEGNVLNLGVDARLAAGYGRVQDVTFAETGLFLLDRISEAMGRKITLDKSGMHDLQAFMEARRKLRPFYDYRKAAIHDLESMVEFIRKHAGTEALPARAILEMSDEWYHSGRHRRSSGWEVRAFPFLKWSWRESSSSHLQREYSRTLPLGAPVNADSLVRLVSGQPPTGFRRQDFRQFDGETSFGAGARASYRRPWRRFYQFELSGHSRFTRVGTENGEEQKTDTLENAESPFTGRYLKIEYPYLEAGWLASAAFFPNSRTSVSADLQGEWWRKMDYLGSKARLTETFGRSPNQKAVSYWQSLGLEADYFLSHRLILRMGIHGSNDWRYSQDEYGRTIWEGDRETPVSESWNPRFGADAGLTYYLY